MFFGVFLARFPAHLSFTVSLSASLYFCSLHMSVLSVSNDEYFLRWFPRK